MELKTEKMIGEKEGGIGWMTFNNPARRNAMSLEMWEAVETILNDFEEDNEIKVIVMKGAGDNAFVSGADISEFKDRRNNAEAAAEYARISEGARARLNAVKKPLIAMIQGFCMGGGLLTAMRADLRIASDNSQFGVPAARLGLGYGYAAVKALVDLIGPSQTREILLTGKRFPAADAMRWGLITRVVTVDELENPVNELAVTIADNAPMTIRAIRQSVDATLQDESRRDTALIDQLVADCFASDDYREGRSAFMEKRRPVFKGC